MIKRTKNNKLSWRSSRTFADFRGRFESLIKSLYLFFKCGIQYLIPFNLSNDDNHFYSSIAENMLNCKFGYNEHNKIFQTFEINHDIDTPLNEVDPDFQFYSDVRHLFNTKCDYYIEDTIRETITKEKENINRLSFFHINVKSLPKHFDDLELYID